MEEKMTCYKLYRGNEIVYVGITNDIERRLGEHKRFKNFTKHKTFGKIILSNAKKWEIDELKKYRRNKGRYPEYSKSAIGSTEYD